MKKRDEFRGTVCMAFLAFLILFAASAARGASPDEALRTLLSSRALDSAQTEVYILDLDAGLVVASHRAGLPITPASVMKCVTTGALSSVIPYSSRLSTKVYLDGNFIAGEEKGTKDFEGRLTIVGSGDPSVSDGNHKGHPELVAMIVDEFRKKGISTFRGEIVVDDSLFKGSPVHPSWPEADLGQSYGTGCHAFNFEGNASGKKSVSNPATVFRRKLAAALGAAGITYVEEPATGSCSPNKLLFEYESPQMGELMRSCMFRSDNLYAEAFLRLFGLQNGADGSAASSARIAMQHWDALNYPLDGVEITDGSGLSRDNRLTAEFLGAVLASRSADPEYVSFFPLVGEEGTVKSFMKDTPLQGRMALKTGSMSGIQSYAGYMLDSDYMPTHVVVVMTNGLKDRAGFRAALGRYFQSIFIR